MLAWVLLFPLTQNAVVFWIFVVLGLLIVGSVLYILLAPPPGQRPSKSKPSPLNYAPPPPPLTLGPRFAEIEAWKRAQEGDQPFLPGVPRLGATQQAPSTPLATDASRAEALAEEADWLNDRARQPALLVTSPNTPGAPGNQDQPTSRFTPEEPEVVSDAVVEAPLESEASLAEAGDEENEELPSLHPVRPGTLAEKELVADHMGASASLAEDGAERVPMEAAEADLPALHPVRLDWVTNDLLAEQVTQQDAALVRHQEQQFVVQPSRPPALDAATQETSVEAPWAIVSSAAARRTPEEMPFAMPIVVQAFGRAQLLVFGRPLEGRANQRLELVLYLAHQATLAGEEREFVDRLIISDDLWPGMPREVSRQLERLRNCKSDLLEDVEKAGLFLEQYPWLETGPENALRLHAAVSSDLAAFVALVEQIAQVREEAGREAPVVGLVELDNWQTRLQQLYQGGLAQQFRPKPWLDKARRQYQAQFFQARFDLARLLARLGANRQAIDLGTETVLAANPRGDGMMRLLVEWVRRQEPIERETWAGRFADEYEQRYGQTLARAHEKMETLRQSVLPAR